MYRRDVDNQIEAGVCYACRLLSVEWRLEASRDVIYSLWFRTSKSTRQKRELSSRMPALDQQGGAG